MARTVKYTVNFIDAEEADLHRFVQTNIVLVFKISSPPFPSPVLQCRALLLTQGRDFRCESHTRMAHQYYLLQNEDDNEDNDAPFIELF